MGDRLVDNLILDLLEWLAIRKRSYEETMEAWRTSCPRLPVWEEANDRGLLMSVTVGGRRVVRPTASGLALLELHRPGELPLAISSAKSGDRQLCNPIGSRE